MSDAVLYSFRRCPYAMRARMALRYSGVAVQIIEVSLKAKPAEMLTLSPKGTVPVLSVDGRVIDESLAIMRWALAQNDPEGWLLGDDRATQALIEENDQGFKHQLNRYKYAERYPEYPMEHYRAEGEVFLMKLEGLLAEREYLLAGHLSLADVALAPFVRQFAHVDREWFGQAPYPRLQGWLQRFLESPLFIAVMAKT
ncbi:MULTISPECIES: glutathione S-transferase [unclassified Pseudomonas]|uniref:glutathione S-transferase n=1 Tax=unclassified Pseudomonas TaxID=196821 RepID=UPI000C8694AB|nr:MULTISPECIES: glutathione S-transferase [unclassified Pseudomonas]PMU24921.1 glutathione S-transferase [Pseudomonas sp. GP01-A9]PMU30429.1 glutathione S-transferase [Pseudomonas sp. GP01-A13]PMU40092.1 glutathione S-transferase [Pseudomonas sp. GP01-A8]PMU46708.1 glutathione S-transferase [Pseudomonas sp. GP01-A14]PMU55141.1 glutathione S-transferase [Pseudomonas sp. GP01-A6]